VYYLTNLSVMVELVNNELIQLYKAVATASDIVSAFARKD
jgi:hypothetical protein